MLYRIKLGSVTNSQRAAKILKANGYRPSVGRLQNPKKEDGCGYAVTLKTENIESVVSLLKSKNINIIGVDKV